MFFFNCVCKDPKEYPYASGSLRRPHPTYLIGSFAHTFSALQKRPLLSKIVYDFLTQAGPKNLPKKMQKKSFGRAWISAYHIQFHFTKHVNLKESRDRTHRGTPYAKGLRAPCLYYLCKLIFLKVFDGTTKNQNTQRDSHAGRQKKRVPEEAEIGRSSTPLNFSRALLARP